MVGDFYTKPLQGALFIEPRDAILGIKQEDIPLYIDEYTQFMKTVELD